MRLRETLIVSGGLLTQQASTFATGILIARALGADDYGVLATLKGLTTFWAIVAPLGLDLALLKHGPLYKERLSELRSLSMILRAISAVLNLCLLALVAVWLGPWLQGIYATVHGFAYLCILSMIGVLFASDIQIFGALYRVEGAVTPYAVAVNYGQPLIRLALSALVVMAGGGVISILWVNALTSLVTLGALVFMDPSLSVSAGRVADLWSKVWHILSESMWMAMLLLVGQAMRFVDVVLLAALSSVKVAGEYTAMSNVAQLILIYPGAISQTLGPEIARLHQSGDRAGMVSALEDYLRKASLLGGYLFGGIAVFGSQLDLVFGAQFTFSWQLAVLLAFGWFVSATLGPVSFALSMTGRHKQDFIILVIGSLVLIVSLGLTIPGLQEVGAAFSVALAFVVVNAIRAIIVGRSLRFNPVKLRDILPPLYFALIAMACAQFGLKAAERGFLNLLCQCIIYSLLSFALYMFVFAKPGESRYVINRLTL